MAYKFIHKYSELSAAALAGRVSDMVKLSRQMVLDGIEAKHVSISKGNRKTGARVPSVSLIPVADCGNCKACRGGCHDVRHDVIWPPQKASRAKNSAIARTDPERFFQEIKKTLKKSKFFRFHVGGDILNKNYFAGIVAAAKEFPACKILVFTKMFDLINAWIAENGPLPENLKLIFSDWRGLEMENPYNLPVSSPVWFDKDGNEIERGPHTSNNCTWCPGSCEDCALQNCGCWNLKPGETVLFEAH